MGVYCILYFLNVKIEDTKNTKINENKTTANSCGSGDNGSQARLRSFAPSDSCHPWLLGFQASVTHIAPTSFTPSRILFLSATHIR